MRNAWTIARREIRLYFDSPIAYIVGLLIFLITGIYFVLTIYLASQDAFTTGSATAPGPDLIVGLMVFLFLFAVVKSICKRIEYTNSAKQVNEREAGECLNKRHLQKNLT